MIALYFIPPFVIVKMYKEAWSLTFFQENECADDDPLVIESWHLLCHAPATHGGAHTKANPNKEATQFRAVEPIVFNAIQGNRFSLSVYAPSDTSLKSC